MNSGDGIQVWAQGSNTLRFDAGFVHVRIVESGNLAGVRVRRRIRLGRLFDQRNRSFVTQVSQIGEDADGATVGGNFRAGDPVAVCIAEKIVSGLDLGIYVGRDNAVDIFLMLVRRCVLRVTGWKGKSDCGANGYPQQRNTPEFLSGIHADTPIPCFKSAAG
jgi:hypothetical protein